MAQESLLPLSSPFTPSLSQNTLSMETENLHKPPSSPPSLSSSPSHDFSFTISLLNLKQPAAAAASPDFVDLSPADDIFFHGHLLPLHFLSHRPSNASVEATAKKTLPIPHTLAQPAASADKHPKERPKAAPFASFFPLRNWLGGTEDREAKKKQSNHKKKKKKKKKKVLFSRLWKKYASLVEPLLFFKAMKEKREFRRSAYSFSGDCNPREGGWRRRWRGDFSAPASMRTSPANSGLLVPPSSTTPAFSSSDESTMEELQNAIQAAIAHCKSSVAVKDDGCGC